mmetsp:Transcript_19158/g.53425  ORF Transcript_19158/g.53425 Transcript_19158/m.53425 type:complete len:104 (+) Transcript_19158:949-1260(+)
MEAAVAAKHMHLLAVSLLTIAGPSVMQNLFTQEDLDWFQDNTHLLQPYVDSVCFLNETYGLKSPLPLVEDSPFVGGYGDVALVTTTENMAEPCSDVLTRKARV